MKDDERINFKQLKITRWIGYGNKIKDAEIHVFPRKLGSIGSCVRSRSIRLAPENKIKSYVTLRTSKTKFAPLLQRKVPLPRLKLLSSLLAVRLGEAVANTQHRKIIIGKIRCHWAGYKEKKINGSHSSGINLKQSRMYLIKEALPRYSESSQSCFVGKAQYVKFWLIMAIFAFFNVFCYVSLSWLISNIL